MSFADARRARIGLAGVAATLTVLALSGHYLLDLKVYRAGGSALAHNHSLYAAHEAGSGLLFTYTPFAGLLAVIPAAVPLYLAFVVWTLGSLACVFAIVTVVADRLATPLSPELRWGLVAGSVVLEPVRATFAFGQVNLLLVCAVTVALLKPDLRTGRGALLLGVAAAVKLTPLIFIPYLLVTGQRRLAAAATAVFAAATGVSWLVIPSDSTLYWFHLVRDTKRIGASSFATNQSWAGVFARFQGNDRPSGFLYDGVVVVTFALGLAVAQRAARRSAPLGVVVAGTTSLLVSPISWSHHWIWLCLLPLVGGPWLSRREKVGLVVVLMASPFNYLPNSDGRELGWSGWEQALGDSYTWAAFIALALIGWRLWRHDRRSGQPAASRAQRRPARSPTAVGQLAAGPATTVLTSTPRPSTVIVITSPSSRNLL